MAKNKKRAIKRALIGVITVGALISNISTQLYNSELKQTISLLKSDIAAQEVINTKLIKDNANLKYPVGKAEDLNWIQTHDSESVTSSISKRDVICSNYFVGDGSSGNTTASGLSIDDFEVNDEGFYTYDGMVVVATGSTRLEGLIQGFVAHELFDKLLVEFNGKTYQSIALDVCGACTWGVDGETVQRVDIFTTHDVFGLENGKVIDIGK